MIDKEIIYGYKFVFLYGVAMWCGFIILAIIAIIQPKEKSYEYAYNGEIGVSDNCYLKNDIAYCEVDNVRIQVDNYYEKESR